MTDVDVVEATGNLGFAKDQVIDQWISEGLITEVSTAGSRIVAGTSAFPSF